MMKNIIWNSCVAGSLLFLFSCSSLPGKSKNQAFDDECNRMKSCIKDMDREFSSLEAHPAAYYEQLVSQLTCRLDNVEGVMPSRVDSLRRVSEDAQERFYKQMGFKWMELLSEEDKIMETGKHVIPMRLYKGDEVQVKLSGSTAFKSVSLKDERTGEVLATENNQSDLTIRSKVRHSSIYLLTIELQKQSYVDLKYYRRSDKKETLFSSTSVRTEKVECGPKDAGAIAKDEVVMEKLYDEPFKATLASQGRAIFGNKDRTMASVQLPKGSTGFFYRLRLSSSKDANHSDGRLGDELISINSSRDLGPIHYNHKMSVSSPFVENMLSSLSSPKCEEEIYCNFYVIKGAKEARKFQDTGSNFVYNLDSSRQNTQSINGFVPSEGLTSFYLGLSNSRFTTSIYVWLEVVAVVPVTKYYRDVYE